MIRKQEALDYHAQGRPGKIEGDIKIDLLSPPQDIGCRKVQHAVHEPLKGIEYVN